jgi:DNA replication ATP-dependent helicase Dna2
MISRFVRLMQEKDWVYEMKAGSLEGHWFPGGGAAGESPVKGSPMKGMGRSPMKAIGGGMGMKSPFKRKGSKRGDEENRVKEEGEEKPLGTSPRKRKPAKAGGLLIAKEPKRRQGISQEVMMKGKTVLKDIVNDLMY